MMDKDFDNFVRVVREHLNAEYERNKIVVDRAKEIMEICDLCITACMDNSPTLARELRSRADKVFRDKY